MSNHLINREDFYDSRHPELRERIKHRLSTLQDKGLQEVGVAEFGITDVVSGLYIERVWHYSDEDFEEYMQFINGVINIKTV